MSSEFSLKHLSALIAAITMTVSLNAVPQNGIEIDKTTYPITGIDINQYLGDINFDLLIKNKKYDIDFIYMRATVGTYAVDKRFEEYYRETSELDCPIGVYHFFKFREGGTVQAQHFLREIKGKKFGLPLVIDIEEWGNSGRFNRQTIITNIRAFIRTVKKERKEKIILYSNRNTYNKYIKNNFSEYPLWICSFTPPANHNLEWVFWQHTHKGRISGINHVVDINTFNGNKKEWNDYIKDCKSHLDNQDK